MIPVESLLEEIRRLPVNERKRLISLIVDTLTEADEAAASRKRNILEFEGVGAEMWRDINSDEYLQALRDEWDTRP